MDSQLSHSLCVYLIWRTNDTDTSTIGGTTPYPLGLGYDAVENVTSILYPGDTTPLT